MSNGQGSIFGIQEQQPGSGGNTEIIIQSLHELVKWVPMTDQGVATINGARGLISQLHRANQSIINDPYWQLRKFGEAMLDMIVRPDHFTTGPAKRIFFFNYEKNEVYMGFPPDLVHDLPPIVMKATLGVEAVVKLSLDEAVIAVQEAGKRIQSWVFGMELKEEPVSTKPDPDWYVVITIEDTPFETTFRRLLLGLFEGLGIHPLETYEAFREKFNLSAILNGEKRKTMDFRLYAVNGEQNWEWVART